VAHGETVRVKQCELPNKIMSTCNEKAVLINTSCGVHTKDRNCLFLDMAGSVQYWR